MVIQEAEDNKMKTFIKSLVLVFGISLFLTGCYTIVWDPSEEFPNEENYSGSSEFYDTDYYGNYGDYYEIPWWIGISPYISSPDIITKDRNNNTRTTDAENIRNSFGRGNTDGDRTIINTPPATQSISGSSSGTTSRKTTEPKNDSGSNITRSSNTSSSSSDNERSSNSSDTRNNSGSRNSDSGRRK
jgi:hypothetical protein